MSTPTYKTSCDAVIITNEIGIPDHLRPGGKCWVVGHTWELEECAQCKGTQKLELASGGTVECQECDDEGLIGYTKWIVASEPALIDSVRIDITANGDVVYNPRFAGLSFWRQTFKRKDLCASSELAQIRADHLNRKNING